MAPPEKKHFLQLSKCIYSTATCCGCQVVNQHHQLSASVKTEQQETTHHDFISKVMPRVLLHSLLGLVLLWWETDCSNTFKGLECINSFPPKFTINAFHCVKKNSSKKENKSHLQNFITTDWGLLGFFCKNNSYILKHHCVVLVSGFSFLGFFYMWFFKEFIFS